MSLNIVPTAPFGFLQRCAIGLSTPSSIPPPSLLPTSTFFSFSLLRWFTLYDGAIPDRVSSFENDPTYTLLAAAAAAAASPPTQSGRASTAADPVDKNKYFLPSLPNILAPDLKVK